MRYIGDVHGKYSPYHRAVVQAPKGSIQVGDLGLGFVKTDGEYWPNPSYDKMVANNARFIRGNHDNPAVCARHKQWIADGTIEDGVMFIGGANSIDRHMRTEGYDGHS